ncbi:Rieske (2Fe-2S) protein [Allorhizocola rhizosphaerae]|uniref:Rieske (2Fe-2S) protein n=1 Tax=Allorhizocola rhizosphaerae TaxID=1872709 RepID=UPI000E3E9BA9|nr:Rieske (2Fe-2S) protein [Allorhizocola rhizosphaerae]
MSEVVCPRRALLAGAGLTMLLAACGENPPPTAPSPSQNTGSGNGDGSLVKAADVPVGGGVVTADNVLVLQLTAGTFTAFSAVCPHQNFRLSPPDPQGLITCVAHQSHFKAADGSRVDGPAPSGLSPIAVQVVDGRVRRVG